jgi:ubiquinone/menaquinone biosynthesis C-methylase UbiE
MNGLLLMRFPTTMVGWFTRRFAAEDKYGRVLGCDYSESTLTEARRRIDAEGTQTEFTQDNPSGFSKVS